MLPASLNDSISVVDDAHQLNEQDKAGLLCCASLTCSHLHQRLLDSLSTKLLNNTFLASSARLQDTLRLAGVRTTVHV